MRFYFLDFPPNQSYSKSSMFNPSIVKLDGENNYLLSCRSFRRFKPTYTNSLVTNTNSLNHPWLNGPKSVAWFTVTDEGFDGTLFFLVRIEQRQIIIVKFLLELDTVIDVRLFKTTDQDVIVTGNKLVNSQTIIVKSTIHITTNPNPNNVYFDMDEFRPLCINLSETTEKNWSYWSYDDKNYISYNLAPKHIIFVEIPDKDFNEDDKEFQLLNQPRSISCLPFIAKDFNLFHDLSKFYKGHVSFSLSTPAIEFETDKYLAVGHSKVSYDIENFDEFSDTPAQQFLDENRDLLSHPAVAYLMFFYTFNPVTLEILEISNSFIPPTTKDGVVFPAGLTQIDEDTFMVSYGEGDFKCKFMSFRRDEIDEYLIKQDAYTIDTYLFKSFHRM